MKCEECITYAICKSTVMEKLNYKWNNMSDTDIYYAYMTNIKPKCDQLVVYTDPSTATGGYYYKPSKCKMLINIHKTARKVMRELLS